MSEFVRVRDKDTGHKRSVHPAEVAHGDYQVLKEPAVDPITGDILPPEYAKPSGEAPVIPTGQSADPKKES
jgi:hypothetical protein